MIEVIFGFRADGSKAWDVEAVKAGLADHFPNFPEVQEQRMFENQILLAPRKDPEPSTKRNYSGAKSSGLPAKADLMESIKLTPCLRDVDR